MARQHLFCTQPHHLESLETFLPPTGGPSPGDSEGTVPAGAEGSQHLYCYALG